MYPELMEAPEYELLNPEYDFEPNSGNELASEAMSLAGQFRSEGDDASTALRKAWAEVKGEGDHEDSPDSSFEASPLVVLLALGGIFTLVYKWQRGNWWWSSLSTRRLSSAANQGIRRLNPGVMRPAATKQSKPNFGRPERQPVSTESEPVFVTVI